MRNTPSKSYDTLAKPACKIEPMTACAPEKRSDVDIKLDDLLNLARHLEDQAVTVENLFSCVLTPAELTKDVESDNKCLSSLDCLLINRLKEIETVMCRVGNKYDSTIQRRQI